MTDARTYGTVVEALVTATPDMRNYGIVAEALTVPTPDLRNYGIVAEALTVPTPDLRNYGILVEIMTSQAVFNPDEPINLSVSATYSTLTLDWQAPLAGIAPTGYEVRIDGGAAIDVGLVLSHRFSGLIPGTTHTLEVRAYA